MGLPQGERDRLTEPYVTTRTKGTGLGLSTVLGIVKSHGGFLNVNSEVNKGTTFACFFPATPNAKLDAKAAKNWDEAH